MRAGPVGAWPESTGGEFDQVRVALRPTAVAPYLAATFGEVIPRGNGHGAEHCHILDVKYEPSRRCTILYDLAGQLVLGVLDWSESLNGTRGSIRTIDGLEMQAFLFPDDPALPGLATVFDREALREVLASALPACLAGEMRLLRCRATLLRYRPTRRYTVRLDLWLADHRTGAVSSSVLYGKVYHDLTKATCVFADMQMLFGTTALTDRSVAVAKPVAFIPELAMILQAPLTGTHLDTLLGRRAQARGFDRRRPTHAVLRVAEALAAIHSLRLQAARRRPLLPALTRLAERAGAIGSVDPQLGGRMASLADTLLTHADELDDMGARTRFVHGDCKPSQFLVGSRVGVLDVDHAGTADPACDVGDFTASLRRLGVAEAVRARGGGLPRPGHSLRGVEERFLARYRESSGSDPGLSARVTWYQGFALLRKAVRAFQRSPWSPLPALLVEEASRCLEPWLSGGVRS